MNPLNVIHALMPVFIMLSRYNADETPPPAPPVPPDGVDRFKKRFDDLDKTIKELQKVIEKKDLNFADLRKEMEARKKYIEECKKNLEETRRSRDLSTKESADLKRMLNLELDRFRQLDERFKRLAEKSRTPALPAASPATKPEEARPEDTTGIKARSPEVKAASDTGHQKPVSVEAHATVRPTLKTPEAPIEEATASPFRFSKSSAADDCTLVATVKTDRSEPTPETSSVLPASKPGQPAEPAAPCDTQASAPAKEVCAGGKEKQVCRSEVLKFGWEGQRKAYGRMFGHNKKNALAKEGLEDDSKARAAMKGLTDGDNGAAIAKFGDELSSIAGSEKVGKQLSELGSSGKITNAEYEARTKDGRQSATFVIKTCDGEKHEIPLEETAEGESKQSPDALC